MHNWKHVGQLHRNDQLWQFSHGRYSNIIEMWSFVEDWEFLSKFLDFLLKVLDFADILFFKCSFFTSKTESIYSVFITLLSAKIRTILREMTYNSADQWPRAANSVFGIERLLVTKIEWTQQKSYENDCLLLFSKLWPVLWVSCPLWI